MGQPRLDLQGKIFGDLTALEAVGKDKKGQIIWRCLCICGSERLAVSSCLVRGGTTSCGCRKQRLSRFVDISGERTGRLLIKRRVANNKAGLVCWECECDCGKTTIVPAKDLRGGNTQSCGCLRAENASKLRALYPSRDLPNGVAARNGFYNRYLKGAQNRGLFFDLTKEDFTILTSQDCHYCGIPPERVYRSVCVSRDNGSYVGNGVDRVDSSKGYTTDNCVPCCRQCNMAKWDLPYDDFVAWVHRASKHLKKE